MPDAHGVTIEKPEKDPLTQALAECAYYKELAFVMQFTRDNDIGPDEENDLYKRLITLREAAGLL